MPPFDSTDSINTTTYTTRSDIDNNNTRTANNYGALYTSSEETMREIHELTNNAFTDEPETPSWDEKKARLISELHSLGRRCTIISDLRANQDWYTMMLEVEGETVTAFSLSKTQVDTIISSASRNYHNIRTVLHQVSELTNIPRYSVDILDTILTLYDVDDTTITGGEDSMERKIARYLSGENVEGITDEVVNEYYSKEKKVRHLVRGERDKLHKPVSDGDKPTSSAKLDDIVPKV